MAILNRLKTIQDLMYKGFRHLRIHLGKYELQDRGFRPHLPTFQLINVHKRLVRVSIEELPKRLSAVPKQV